MGTTSTSVESYAHKAAKAVLCGWLRDTAEAEKEDRWVNFCGIEWRPNRGGPHHGVWEEYPFVAGDTTVWDEVGWHQLLLARREHGNTDYASALKYVGHSTVEYLNPVRIGQYGAWLNVGRRSFEVPVDDVSSARPPTFDELTELGWAPQAIADVAIQHKGSIIHAFEVVHKHDVSPKKWAFYREFGRSCGMNVYTIDAGWILSQIARPSKLVVRESIRW